MPDYSPPKTSHYFLNVFKPIVGQALNKTLRKNLYTNGIGVEIWTLFKTAVSS